MKHILLALTLFLPLFLVAMKANAQTGWITPLRTNADSLNGILPPVNQPQPGWSPMLDLKSSDGTATVPPCSDPVVLATVKDGILKSSNDQWPPTMSGPPVVNKVAFSTVWVHPTYSNGTVCDVQVQLDVAGTGPEEWEFQPYATNGEVDVFFYDKDDQGNQ